MILRRDVRIIFNKLLYSTKKPPISLVPNVPTKDAVVLIPSGSAGAVLAEFYSKGW